MSFQNQQVENKSFILSEKIENETSELDERRDHKGTEVPLKECPICYDEIDEKKNCVTTECGHTFHCSCLMKNSAVNGFGCPMCRSVMAEEPEDDDDEDDYDSYYEEDDQFDDNALTSFRMFHQQLDDEEVELEPDNEVIEDDDEDVEDEVVETPATIATKLAARGITMEDVVKVLLLEHGEYSRYDEQYERKASELYGEIRRILSTFHHSGQSPLR